MQTWYRGYDHWCYFCNAMSRTDYTELFIQCLLLTTSSQYKVNYGLLHKNGFISEISQLTVFCFYWLFFFPADIANIGMSCCCHGNERNLYVFGCDSEIILYRNGPTIRRTDTGLFMGSTVATGLKGKKKGQHLNCVRDWTYAPWLDRRYQTAACDPILQLGLCG